MVRLRHSGKSGARATTITCWALAQRLEDARSSHDPGRCAAKLQTHPGGTKKAIKGTARPATGNAVAPTSMPLTIQRFCMSGTGPGALALTAEPLAMTERGRATAGRAARGALTLRGFAVTAIFALVQAATKR